MRGGWMVGVVVGLGSDLTPDFLINWRRDAVREKDGHSEAEARLEAARTEVGRARLM